MPVDLSLSETNRRIVEDHYKALENGDLDDLFELLSDDIEWTTPASLGDMGGYHRGKREVRNFFDYVGERLSLDELSVDRYVADGDTVVVLGTERVTIFSTNKSYATSWAHVLTLANKKIISFTEYVDPGAALAAMSQD